jgi:hypothetical protein
MRASICALAASSAATGSSSVVAKTTGHSNKENHVKKFIRAVLLLLGGLTLILSTSVAPAHAGILPLPGPEHDGNNAVNSNATDQSAYANAVTKQSNFNVPVSVLSFGSNNGGVWQSNDAGTQANAENANATNQGAAGQQAGPWDGGNKGDNNGRNDQATNDNRTEQDAGANAFTKQVNVNAPISVLSYGSNNGNVDQSNQGYTNANAENYNSTKQSSGEDHHQQPKHEQQKQCDGQNGQQGQGQNQYGQNQNGYGPQGHDQAQSGTNSNDTHQRANADAYTKQKNFNAPVSFLSFGSNNGNVDQSNKAYTNADAENLNSTYQKADGHDGQPAEAYSRYGTDGSKDGGNEFKSPSNENRTDQHAYAKAKTEQKNVNFPISFLSFGSNNGNVQQHNNAGTQAFAGNGNWTGQFAGPMFGNG